MSRIINISKETFLYGTLMMVCFFIVLPASYSQIIKVDEETDKAINIGTDVASNIPYVGPFISPISMILFGTESEPSYAEMQAEWQGYTNTRIQESRRKDLADLLEGYRQTIYDIEKSKSSKEFRDLHEQEIRKWERLSDAITRDIPTFISRDDEPAMPLLPMLGAVLNLQIDALDRVYILHKYHYSGDNRQAVLDNLRETIDRKVKEANQLIEKELSKVLKERLTNIGGARKHVGVSNYDLSYQYYVFDWYTPSKIASPVYFADDKGLARNIYSTFYPTDRQIEAISVDMANDKSRSHKYMSEEIETVYYEGSKYPSIQAKVIRNLPAKTARLTRDTTEVWYINYQLWNLVHTNRLNFKVQENINMRVDNLSTDISFATFKEAMERFGEVKKAGFKYVNPHGEIWIGEMDELEAKKIGFKFTGSAYVEIDRAHARETMAYWNSESGKARSKKEGLSNSWIYIEEDKNYDPWKMKVRHYGNFIHNIAELGIAIDGHYWQLGCSGSFCLEEKKVIENAVLNRILELNNL